MPARTASPTGFTNAPTSRLRFLAIALAKILLLLAAAFIAYYWTAVSPRVLIRFDRTGLDPGEEAWGRPVAVDDTLLMCLTPAGWLITLGIFALAFTIAWTIRRWPWPLRILIATAPSALILYQSAFIWNLRSDVRPFVVIINTAETALAILAAMLCPWLLRCYHHLEHPRPTPPAFPCQSPE